MGRFIRLAISCVLLEIEQLLLLFDTLCFGLVELAFLDQLTDVLHGCLAGAGGRPADLGEGAHGAAGRIGRPRRITVAGAGRPPVERPRAFRYPSRPLTRACALP